MCRSEWPWKETFLKSQFQVSRRSQTQIHRVLFYNPQILGASDFISEVTKWNPEYADIHELKKKNTLGYQGEELKLTKILGQWSFACTPGRSVLAPNFVWSEKPITMAQWGKKNIATKWLTTLRTWSTLPNGMIIQWCFQTVLTKQMYKTKSFSSHLGGTHKF